MFAKIVLGLIIFFILGMIKTFYDSIALTKERNGRGCKRCERLCENEGLIKIYHKKYFGEFVCKACYKEIYR